MVLTQDYVNNLPTANYPKPGSGGTINVENVGYNPYSQMPLGWMGGQNYFDIFKPQSTQKAPTGQPIIESFGGDPAATVFANMFQNNPLATGVGKYSAGLLSLLNTPEFEKIKNFESSPEWKKLEESMSPDLYIKKAAPGVEEAFGQARTRGRGALARGGLAGSGAEAALEDRLGYGRAKAQGDITTAGEDYANQVAQFIFGARNKQLGDIQNFRQSVLKDIVGSAVESKLSGQQSKFGPAETAQTIAGIAKLFG